MVSCLILYHASITSLTKCKIIRAMFHEEKFEIHVLHRNTVIVYVWNVGRKQIWQAALLFESTDIITGYGFGRWKVEAIENAWDVLNQKLINE